MAKPMTYCLLACVWIGVMVAYDLEVAPVCAGPDDESCGGHGKCTDEYKCVCTDGYTGEKCESCIEESAGVVCQKDYCKECHERNTTLCVKSRTIYCQCLPGHQPVYNGVCLPGCTEDSCTEPNHHCNSFTFKCECKLGYEMIDGACKKKCPGGCGAHGVCVGGTCFCKDGYFGTNCEVSPTCTEEGTECGDNGKCLNYECICNDGFRGEKCEDEIPCAERCLHGTCEQEKCIKCEDGYTGSWCEVVPVCAGPDDESCGEHGTCTDGFICECTDGYTGWRCEVAPVCAGTDDESCGEHGTCADEYKCVCADGYSGETCEVECNGHGEPDEWSDKCECTDGYTGERCEIAPECTPYDYWSCGEHGTCTDEYKCVCADGYTGETCEAPCNGHGKLDDSAKSCECEDGYSGDTCEVAPACTGSYDNWSCGEHGTCTVEYICVCADGYTGEKCEDAPVCAGTDDKKSCGEHGTCTDEYKCECADGYIGEKCEGAPECTGPYEDWLCGERGKCTDEYKCVCTDGYAGEKCEVECNGHGTLDGSYECYCANGYSGYMCEIAPECAGPYHWSCGEHGTCTDEYKCECTDGYTGEKCEIAPVCAGPDDDKKSCGEHGTCTDEYRCECTDGYTGENCEVVSSAISGGDDSRYHAEAWYIVVGCLGSVIIIALIAVFLRKDCGNGIAYKRFTGSDTSKQDVKSSTSADFSPQEVVLPAEDSTVNVDIERQE